MTKKPIDPGSTALALDNERLRQKCVRQRRELRRLNRVIQSMRGALAWFEHRKLVEGEPAAAVKVALHHRNNALRRELNAAHERIRRLESHLIGRSPC